MAIVKNIRLDTGVSVSYHTVAKTEADYSTNLFRVDFKSHSDEESALAGMPPAWCWSVSVETWENVPTKIEDLEMFVVNTVSMFNGGITTPDLTNSLASKRTRKISEISKLCEAHIYEGFKCSALGSEFKYPAKDKDQKNLMASFADSLIEPPESTWTTPFWCADDEGVWEFRDHSVSQIQDVGRSGKVAILEALRRNEIIQRIIQVCPEENLSSITWDMNLEPYV